MEARMIVDHQFKEEEIRITRYRKLAAEVSDPLAICLLRIVLDELEADLQRDCHGVQLALPA